MDAFHMMATGWVGRVHGWRTAKYNQEVYRFSMATHRVKGDSQEVLWLQVSVPDPICNIVAERGLIPGEQVLVMTSWADLAATVHGTQARPWLNITCTNLVFLTNTTAPAIERGVGLLDRSDTSNVIDYNLLLAIKGQRVG